MTSEHLQCIYRVCPENRRTGLSLYFQVQQNILPSGSFLKRGWMINPQHLLSYQIKKGMELIFLFFYIPPSNNGLSLFPLK